MPTQRHHWLIWVTATAYALVGLEILIMISPFALFFYSGYGPLLEVLGRSPYTNWLAEFFLPHMVFPADSLIHVLLSLQLLFVVGLVLFLLAAVPLYYGRFTGKGVVQWGFYSRIRHPQYLFLAISGLGLLLYWPRFMILILYITMLFLYYLLACNEEWRMRREQPESYAAYMARTSMFLPGNPGGKIYSLLLGWIKLPWAGIATLYILVMFLAVGTAAGLRTYTTRHIGATIIDSQLLVPVFPRSREELSTLFGTALQEQQVRSFLEQRSQPCVVYNMSASFFLTALVTDANPRVSPEVLKRYPDIIERWQQEKFRGGIIKFFRLYFKFFTTLQQSWHDYPLERLLFVQILDSDGRPLPVTQAFTIGVRRDPLLLVDIDAETLEVVGIVPLSGLNKWGMVPMPTF